MTDMLWNKKTDELNDYKKSEERQPGVEVGGLTTQEHL